MREGAKTVKKIGINSVFSSLAPAHIIISESEAATITNRCSVFEAAVNGLRRSSHLISLSSCVPARLALIPAMRDRDRPADDDRPTRRNSKRFLHTCTLYE